MALVFFVFVLGGWEMSLPARVSVRRLEWSLDNGPAQLRRVSRLSPPLSLPIQITSASRSKYYGQHNHHHAQVTIDPRALAQARSSNPEKTETRFDI